MVGHKRFCLLITIPPDQVRGDERTKGRFADYKESMIALLAKVVRVSVDTVAITEAMKAIDRSGWAEAE